MDLSVLGYRFVILLIRSNRSYLYHVQIICEQLTEVLKQYLTARKGKSSRKAKDYRNLLAVGMFLKDFIEQLIFYYNTILWH